jgi:hypothetical protein
MRLYVSKKCFIHRLVCICFLLTPLFYSYSQINAVTTEEIQDDEIVRTIGQINELRSLYDLPLVTYNDFLNKTALTHNLYMQYNDVYTSIEESGKLYYRGRYPWDRASYNGYQNKYVFELLNNKVINLYDGLVQLLQNPYSRYSILDPLYTNLGMNTTSNYTTYLFGGASRSKSYDLIYPYNRQKNVSNVFENKFTINPYTQVGDTESIVGIPITYHIYSSDGKVIDIKNISSKLINLQTNEVINTKIITSLEDRNLTNSIMILPLEPYNFGTTYKITLSAEIYFDRQLTFDLLNYSTQKNIDYDGIFTTINNSKDVIQNTYVTREQFVIDLLKKTNFPTVESLEIIFPDVKTTSPNYKYIYTAYINKIVNGYKDGLYRPSGNITREQAYTILIRLYEKQKGLIIINDSDRILEFSDVKSISTYALDPIYKAKKLGILIDNQFEFLPKTYISINEFEQILERYDNN